MDRHLSFDAALREYQRQADALLAGWRAEDDDAVRFFWQNHPRFRRPDVLWLPKQMEKADLLKEVMAEDDARLAVAYWYDFRDWVALTDWVEAVNTAGSPVSLFEVAVEAVISGEAAGLDRLLREHPELVRARSTRITWWKAPQTHRATLLHYLGANGIEGYREKTPPNAVEIMTILLRAGAEVDALADMYEGQYPTLTMLVSSGPPAQAGLQIPMAETLLDAGEDPSRYNPEGNHGHSTPLHQAVISGRDAVVRLLVERGARLDIRDTIHNGTPLGWAEYGNHSEIATYLRTRGAPQ